MKDDRATILLVDDHAIVREGYRSLLQKQPRLRVVAEAADGATAYRLFKETRPDIVITDLTMHGLGGFETIKRIRQWDPAQYAVSNQGQAWSEFGYRAFRLALRQRIMDVADLNMDARDVPNRPQADVCPIRGRRV